MEAVEKTPVRLKVATILRNAILSGEFTDGQELSLTDTAARLKVSRTPVREALQLLESEGLVELRMNREAVVRSIDERFVRDHFDMRILLEGEAVRRASGKMPMDSLLALQKSVPLDDSAAIFAMYDAYNHDFHHLIWEGAGNQKLYAILESLWNGPSYSRTSGGIVEHDISVREHGTIIDHMVHGHADAAAEAMKAHIRRSMDIILASIITKE